ncbi:hypothetical protein A6R68_03855 [Neotoma lepida]|uniref:SPATA31-like domain-containing protein n=1 Tax=Neotoma lepida TaxID=56216 RepID=A0A1A6GQF5_NEOLE|nr:hypothetical protein A6R68_03855 [Neotoma lepida]
MLGPTFILWDVGYPLYTYGSIFIIALVIWHMKRSHRRLKLGPNKSCHKRTSKEEAEKLQKLLSIMKSHNWLPQEGSVRRLLCSEPSCPICNAMELEIQQLLKGENKKAASISLRTSQSFPCLEALPPSKAEFDRSPSLCPQYSRDISLASSLTPAQSTDQKSSAQSASLSTGDSDVRYYYPDHWQKQEPQGSNVSQDAGFLSSSSVEEPGIPANQQKKRRKTEKSVLKDQAPSEDEAENKMTFYSHWVNPEVKCDRLEEPFVLFKSEIEAKPKTKEPKQCQTPVRDHTEEANMEQTTKDPKAKPLSAKKNI